TAAPRGDGRLPPPGPCVRGDAAQPPRIQGSGAPRQGAGRQGIRVHARGPAGQDVPAGRRRRAAAHFRRQRAGAHRLALRDAAADAGRSGTTATPARLLAQPVRPQEVIAMDTLLQALNRAAATWLPVAFHVTWPASLLA